MSIVYMQNAYGTVKGKMTCVSAPAVRGAERGFSVTEGLTRIGWGAPRGVDDEKKAVILAALPADAGKVPTAPDPYFFGKQACCTLPPADMRLCRKCGPGYGMPGLGLTPKPWRS